MTIVLFSTQLSEALTLKIRMVMSAKKSIVTMYFFRYDGLQTGSLDDTSDGVPSY